MCQTGNDSPASRPEFIDLYAQEKAPTASQAAMVSDEGGGLTFPIFFIPIYQKYESSFSLII